MYRVENFEFESEEEARTARREAEGIKYIKTQVRLDDPDQVLKLYNGLIQRSAFSTPLGYAFLREMQRYLLAIPYIRKEEILPIQSALSREEADRGSNEDERVQRTAKSRSRRAGERSADYRVPFMVSTFFAVVFGLSLVGVFVITALSGNSVNIINYERALIDKYEAWEQELTERENALRTSALEQESERGEPEGKKTEGMESEGKESERTDE